MNDTLAALDKVLTERKQAQADSSYVASLYHKGLNKILEKVGEEAVETILSARDTEAGGDPQSLISETADLWFHCLVMLSHMDLDYRSVMQELERRFDLSGLEEKAQRTK